MSQRYSVKLCSAAGVEHYCSNRQYAHVFHRSGVICLARRALSLPAEKFFGIILHELGHLSLARSPDHTEAEADQEAYRLSGIHIYRGSDRNGSDLETIHHRDVNRAIAYITKRTDLSVEDQ